ncbi:hypothetical protein XM73_u0029 [Vibrio vulnificus]|nr:hypothetical protein XM73_u0029 [Vibrio vulnificus]
MSSQFGRKYAYNKQFKRDSQRLAFCFYFNFSVYGTMR